MSFWRPNRIRQEELLDTDSGSIEEVHQSLQDLRRINRFLGGHRASLLPLRQLVEKFSLKHFSLLDVATGSADFPMAVAHWAHASQVTCHITGVDINPRHLAFAQQDVKHFSGIGLAVADFEHLPFPPGSFDFVNASLFLHHIDDRAVAPFLKNLSSMARIALIINDLERHWVPYVFLKLTQPLFARSRITRFDGFASLLQAFTASELRSLARKAGLRTFGVTRRFPYRLALVVTKSGMGHFE